MNTIRAAALMALTSATMLAPALRAHGGQYLGPTSNPGPPVARGPNGQPLPPGMIPGAPLTGGNADLIVSSWRVWWELNHDRYVARDPRDRVTDDVRRSAVLPTLVAALERTEDPDINSACLIALGKAAVDHPDIVVLDVLRARLSRGNIEVREAAVLAMGISGDPAAYEDLDALLRDNARGRRLTEGQEVGDRVRTFAAYALGLLANRSDSAALKERILESLLAVLQDRRVKERDVLTGVLNGIRLIEATPEGSSPARRSGSHKRVRWIAIAALEEYLERRLTDQMAVVQSHALTALAALVGRGDGVDQQRAKELIGEVLQRGRQQAETYCAATIALGELLEPEDTDHLEALARRIARPPDDMVQNLGMVALGRIGGEFCRAQLTRAFRGDDRGVQAWAALGLGLLAFHAPAVDQQQGDGDVVRAEIGELLLAGLRANRNRDVQAAIAIGLGLAGHADAAPELRKLVDKYGAIEDLSGPVCVALAMLDDRESIPLARDAMRNADLSVRFGHAALALARFDQRDASSIAVGVLQSGGVQRLGALQPGALRRLAAAAKAIGHLKNPSDVPSLCRLIDSADRGDLPAAFAAAALGSVADQDRFDFGARVARGMNYTAQDQTISNGRNGVLDIF